MEPPSQARCGGYSSEENQQKVPAWRELTGVKHCAPGDGVQAAGRVKAEGWGEQAVREGFSKACRWEGGSRHSGTRGPAGGKFAVAAQGGAEGREEGREVMPRGLQ